MSPAGRGAEATPWPGVNARRGVEGSAPVGGIVEVARMAAMAPDPPRQPPSLQPLVISAPFGNYVQPAGATATLGTFTALPRPGRVLRIIKTVRRYRRLGAWVNRIGLRNPGIEWLARRVRAGRVDPADKLISIHGFDESEWTTLLDEAVGLKPLGVELNMSCPNVGEVDWPPMLFAEAAAKCEAAGAVVVVKLPPIRYELIVEQALAGGIAAFHCCNTLPVPGGGMSGRPLKPLSLHCIGRLRADLAGDRAGALTIIGGGGIAGCDDIDDYADAGATRFALGTKVMHPRYLFSAAPLTPLLDRARERGGEPGPGPRPEHRGQRPDDGGR